MTGLDPLEVAAGWPVGLDRQTAALSPGASVDPYGALSDALADALARPPCGVAFSGGVDSSLLLALAADTARRLDLPPPVPVTGRFPRVPEAEEAEWQELVIAHLGLEREWIRFEVADELDLVGDLAGEIMDAAGGPYWPVNVHFLARAGRALGPGGTLLTGGGGDEVFQPAAWPAHLALRAGKRPRSVRELVGMAVPVTPQPVRSLACLVDDRASAAWLTPVANLRYGIRMARAAGAQPVGFGRVLSEWLWRSRYLQGLRRSTGLVTAITGVDIRHFFLEPTVLVALGRYFGRSGPRHRRAAASALGAGLLPDAVLERRTKATFNGAYWGAGAERFAREAHRWLPRAVRRQVDIGVLRAMWAGPNPHAGTWWLFQAAWSRWLNAAPAPARAGR